MQDVLNILNYVAASIPWDAVIASGILSPLLLGVKKWFSVQSEKVMIVLVLISGVLVASGNYLLNVPTSDPSIIAVQGAVLAFMTQPIYFFVVKPFFRWFGETLAAAAAFKADAQSATVPSEGLPISPVISDVTPANQSFTN